MTETKERAAAADVDDDNSDRRDITGIRVMETAEMNHKLLDELSVNCIPRFLSGLTQAAGIHGAIKAMSKQGFYQVPLKSFQSFSIAEESATKAKSTELGQPCPYKLGTRFPYCLRTKHCISQGIKTVSNDLEASCGPGFQDDMFKFLQHAGDLKVTGNPSGRKQEWSDIQKGVLYGPINGIPLYIGIQEEPNFRKLRHLILVRVYADKKNRVRTFNIYRGCAACGSTVDCSDTFDKTVESKKESVQKKNPSALVHVCKGCNLTEYCSTKHQKQHLEFHQTQCQGLARV